MKVIVACGGTGGHSFPGLAVASELVRRGHEVSVWNSGRDIESRVLSGWSGPTFATYAKQLRPRNAFALVRSIWRCRREMRKSRPDALLAMGSYSSLPPVLAARAYGVPVVLHEANTVPGRAVDYLSRYAKRVAISFEMTAKYLKNVPTELTGLPVRSEIARGSRFDFIPNDSFTVFVTGGSQGAHAVNTLAVEAIRLLAAELARRGETAKRRLYVIHQTGEKDEVEVTEAYSSAHVPARVHAFEREMASAFASADVVVARAGASTCFELAACAKPAMLIPLPTALRDHQHFNAEAFAERGAAAEAKQSMLSPHQLFRFLLGLYDDPGRLARMAEKMRELATPDAAERVADMIEAAAGAASAKTTEGH